MKITGDKALIAKLEKLAVKATSASKSALYAESANIIADSQENYVPVDSGNLRNSAFTEQPKVSGGTISNTFGYGGTAAPYAAAVHEIPRAGKTGGVSPSGIKYKTWAKTGGWKFLEFPLKKAMPGMAERLAERIKNGIR